MTSCICGHPKADHVYEEGACRPGFECPCREYEPRGGWASEYFAQRFPDGIPFHWVPTDDQVNTAARAIADAYGSGYAKGYDEKAATAALCSVVPEILGGSHYADGARNERFRVAYEIRQRWQESERVPVAAVLNLIDCLDIRTRGNIRTMSEYPDVLELLRSYRAGVHDAPPDDKPDVLEALDFMIDQVERMGEP